MFETVCHQTLGYLDCLKECLVSFRGLKGRIVGRFIWYTMRSNLSTSCYLSFFFVFYTRNFNSDRSIISNLLSMFLVCNHVTRRPRWGSKQYNFFSKNLRENRVKLPEERNAFVLDLQHGRRDVTCTQAMYVNNIRKKSIPCTYTAFSVQSRDQKLCTFVASKEIVKIRKEFNSQRILPMFFLLVNTYLHTPN